MIPPLNENVTADRMAETIKSVPLAPPRTGPKGLLPGRADKITIADMLVHSSLDAFDEVFEDHYTLLMQKVIIPSKHSFVNRNWVL